MRYTQKKRYKRRYRCRRTRGGVKIEKRKKTRFGKKTLPGPSPLRRSETNKEGERELEMKRKIKDAIKRLKESEREDKLSPWELYEQ
jgi:hypothetical protein